MCREWLKRQMRFYREIFDSKDNKFYVLAGWEIALIVVAIILVFGVGKLANIGGALGKSIREFRQEKDKDKLDDVPQLNTKNTEKEKDTQPEAKSADESKD